MIARLTLLFILTIPLLGCGGPKYAEVTGTVTVEGKPVAEGMIMFHPESGPTAVGAIQNGQYSLKTSTQSGAIVGKHRVTIEATKVAAGRLEEPKSLEEELNRSRTPGQKWLVAGEVTRVVPERYSRPETSDLNAEVKPEPNTINYDLPAK